jgi:hypothetical protein
MPLARITLAVALALVTGCGAAERHVARTPTQVAAIIRSTWGSTVGFPSFDYSCKRLDDTGRVFTCVAQDANDIVKLASFDVVCDDAKCTWTDYPTYIG